MYIQQSLHIKIENTHRFKFTGFIITYAAVRPAARLQLAFATPSVYTPVPDILITSHALLATFTVSPPSSLYCQSHK